MLAPIVLAVVIATVVVAVSFAVARPALRAIAVRNARRRPGRALLVATGVLLATATLVSASIVGDSLRASIRRSAFTQLGPIDEEVVGSGAGTGALAPALDRAHLAGVDGVVPFVSLFTTVQSRDFVPRVVVARVVELDFAAGARFGGDAAATGISGPTPSGQSAVVNADLAEQFATAPGHRVTIYAYGTARTFRIDRVLPQLGLAGLEAEGAASGSPSPNVFVPPGTIAAMRREGHERSAAAPTLTVAVSNRGGVLTSRSASDTVTAELQHAVRGRAVEVLPVKRRLLDDAAAQSNQFGAIFRVFGIFSALGGVLLLILTFGALARERARALGILRAMGLRRRDLITTLMLEGWLYCLVGVVLGAGVGVGIAALVVVAAKGVLSNAAAGGVELVLAVRGATLVLGAAIALIISLVALVATAAVVARTDIVALIRGDAGARRSIDRRALRTLGVVLGSAGLVVALVGIIATNVAAAAVGAAVVMLAATALAAPRWRQTVAVAGAAAVLIFTAAEVRVGHRVFAGPAPAELFAVAAVMSFAAVVLVSSAHRVIARRGSGIFSRRSAPSALGFAYSHATPVRTAIISAMYAVVVFTLCLVITVAHLYAGNAGTVAQELGGGAQIEVTSNPAEPVPARAVRELAGVTRVVGARALDARLLTGGSNPVANVTLIGVGPALVGHGTPPIAAVAPGFRADGLYQRVIADPSLVVVGADLQTTPQNTLDHRTPRAGDTLQIQDPTTGTVRRVRIAGLVADARYAGIDHIYGSNALMRQLQPAPVAVSVLYVETAPGTNDDTVAAIIDGTHLANGAYARSFPRLARERLSAQQQFLNILTGYAALGLAAGAAALAVAMIDRVRERRRQLAMLRAIGFRASTLRRALRIEAALVGLEGTVAGALAAILLAWRLSTTGALGDSFAFSLPGIAIAVIVVTALVSALVATTVAARRAARLQPAGALRAEE